MNFLRQRAPRQSLLRGIGIAVAVLLLQAGCGQKGPLYRPDATPPRVSSPAGTETSGKKKSQPVLPAPQSQKRDRPPATPEPPPSDPASQPTPEPGQPTAPPPGN